MGVFDNLFGKKTPPRVLEDPVFGRLTYGKHDGWENRSFAFWGQSAIQLLVDSDDAGPTARQGLYADSGWKESRVVREHAPELLFIRPDVAVVHEFHERDGQRLQDGTVISRRTHTTFVVSKEGGTWVVQYQFIGDERVRASPP